MKLTHELIMQYRTPRGGWLRVQLEALGVSWPPAKGWARGAVGMNLTDEQFLQFKGVLGTKESPTTALTLSTQKSARLNQSTVISTLAVQVPRCGCDVLAWEPCKHTENTC